MIKVGDRIPAVNLTRVTSEGNETVAADELFSGKKVVLFAVPGAFTPTCSNAHLPGYVVNADTFFDKGVDMIACLSVNDGAVMRAWQQAQNAEQITMLADGGAAFTRALGLELDTGDFGGIRSQRYAAIVDDGVVTMLNVEAPKAFEVSDAETLLKLL
ncbi:peroxiredoxin [Marinobacterium nitratireducens]|uniref:Glutathione-dependent peroxiredoxin n=1 Tax=Marinobacterium nitratireducens TaxID=518897 RepID=A0A917ZKY3_9GAMM|nr:peroxiredoxin [Marinobacterium nitratireducens]GGO85848.1 peroxiredoxin [Marinobacterium nitratireducens]